MNLDIENPAFIYSLFLSLAHIVSWAILFWYGYRNKYPKIQWLLIIVTGYICFTIGSHVLAVNAESLKMAISNSSWPISMGKSLIGGFLLAIPAMLLVKYLLGFNRAIFEPYAFTIPLGIAIQRMGCLAAGCCYGSPTDLPWGISYNHGHILHYTQWPQGQIAGSDLQSLALHPVQVYESILCLLILAVVIYAYKTRRLQNQLIYVFLLLYAITRFFTEFFRAEAAHTLGLNSYLGLNTVQWIMMIFALLFLFILVRGSKSNLSEGPFNKVKSNFSLKEFAWYILLFTLILVTPNFYSPLELLLLGILFVPLSSLVFWQFFKSITVPKLRIATVSICVIGVFLMSQKSPVRQGKVIPKDFHEISVGGYLGLNEMTYYTTGCDGTKHPKESYNERYYLMGVGYKFVNEFNNGKKITLGFSASYGSVVEEVEGTGPISSSQHDMYVFSPFIQYDFKKVGIGLGLMAGDISLIRAPDYNPPLTSIKQFSILPQVHFRVGNLQKVWGEFNYGYRFPSVVPATEFELLLGVRGQNGNLFRFGTSAHHALVARPTFFFNRKFSIEPFLGVGGPLFSGSFTNRMGFEGGVNLHYRILK